MIQHTRVPNNDLQLVQACCSPWQQYFFFCITTHFIQKPLLQLAIELNLMTFIFKKNLSPKSEILSFVVYVVSNISKMILSTLNTLRQLFTRGSPCTCHCHCFDTMMVFSLFVGLKDRVYWMNATRFYLQWMSRLGLFSEETSCASDYWLIMHLSHLGSRRVWSVFSQY